MAFLNLPVRYSEAAIANHVNSPPPKKFLLTRRNQLESGAKEVLILLTGIIVGGDVTSSSLSKCW